jgi:hypothetical protein
MQTITPFIVFHNTARGGVNATNVDLSHATNRRKFIAMELGARPEGYIIDRDF